MSSVTDMARKMLSDDTDSETEIEIPDLDDLEELGTALAVVYQDETGRKFLHEFAHDAVLVGQDGILLIVVPDMMISELGIEE
jgi:hypothetical protein